MAKTSKKTLTTGLETYQLTPHNEVPKNYFDLSHEVKLTCSMGNLIPIAIIECTPGDNFDIASESLIRFQPLVSPVMHRMDCRSEWFFVPHRLVWDNFEKWYSPMSPSAIPPAVPRYAGGTAIKGQLHDNFGLPVGIPLNGAMPSALPAASYRKIWYDWYRDEDITGLDTLDENYYKVADGLRDPLLFGPDDLLKQRMWDKDYFTSARPTAQKGPAVVVPTFTSNAVISLSASAGTGVAGTWRKADGSNFTNTSPVGINANTASGSATSSANGTGQGNLLYDPNGTLALRATTAAQTAGTIAELRRAEALQHFLEMDLMGGTMFIETIENHFGVRSSDARLHRSEYIGSTYQPITISEVLNTAGLDGQLPQGNMAGHAVSTEHGGKMEYFCEEPGYIIGLMSILPKTSYCQGVHPMWQRTDRLDMLWPEFANIGMQPVKRSELYYQNNAAQDSAVFGYQMRYGEHRSIPNRVAGDFRDTLDYWSLVRKFSSPPTLNTGFIEVQPADSDRIFAVQDGTDQIIANWYHKITVKRALPKVPNYKI